jgi:hypothetical protein
MRAVVINALALGLILALAACGDDDDDESDEDPLDELSIPEFEPADHICRLEDIPPAFEYETLSSGPISNEESADHFATDPAERVEQYASWGRESGQLAIFSSEAQAESPAEVAYFECAIDSYRTVEGAERAFSTLRRSLDERTRLSLEAQGFEEITFEDIPSPQIGDETEAVGGAAVKDGANFEFFSILFRHYNMVGYSLSLAPEDFSFVEDAANISALMVRLLDEQVDEANEDDE